MSVASASTPALDLLTTATGAVASNTSVTLLSLKPSAGKYLISGAPIVSGSLLSCGLTLNEGVDVIKTLTAVNLTASTFSPSFARVFDFDGVTTYTIKLNCVTSAGTFSCASAIIELTKLV